MIFVHSSVGTTLYFIIYLYLACFLGKKMQKTYLKGPKKQFYKAVFKDYFVFGTPFTFAPPCGSWQRGT